VDWDDSVGTPKVKRSEGGEAEGGGAIGTPAGQH
jgi:hypothetical protein